MLCMYLWWFTTAAGVLDPHPHIAGAWNMHRSTLCIWNSDSSGFESLRCHHLWLGCRHTGSYPVRCNISRPFLPTVPVYAVHVVTPFIMCASTHRPLETSPWVPHANHLERVHLPHCKNAVGVAMDNPVGVLLVAPSTRWGSDDGTCPLVLHQSLQNTRVHACNVATS